MLCFQNQWVGDMRTDSAVAAYAIAPEDHWTFLTGLAAGQQDYDLLYKRAKEDDSSGETKSAKKWGKIFRKFDEGK